MGETRPYLRGKMVDFLGRDFPFEVNHKIVVKLNTGCVQNVVTTWRDGLGRPRLGTDAEDFFPGTGHRDTYPHLDEVHVMNFPIFNVVLFLMNIKLTK